MQNILLSGFENEPSANAKIGDDRITAKLGDLGIVMEPAKGLVQPIVYRAPEVYFRNEINQPADIWSWGVIYCQLLEAQASFNKYGLYDELLQGNSGQGQKERSVERAIAHDFGLGALDYYDGCRLPYQDRSHHEGQHWEQLKAKGVPEKEIKFLSWVLNPVPTDRPTAQQILDAGWFTMDTAKTGKIADKLEASAQESRRRNIQRKRSELCSPIRRRNSSRPGCIRGSLLPHFLPRILLPTLLRGLLHLGSHSRRNRTRIYHLNPSRNSRRNRKDKDTSLRHTSPCLSNPLLSRRVRKWGTRQGLLRRDPVRRNRVAVRF